MMVRSRFSVLTTLKPEWSEKSLALEESKLVQLYHGITIISIISPVEAIINHVINDSFCRLIAKVSVKIGPGNCK